VTTRGHEGRLNKALAAGKAWPSAEQIQMMKPDDCSAVRAPITFVARDNSHYPAHIDRDEAGPARQRRPARCTSSAKPPFASVLAEARRIGLLAIGKMERISFHAPPALVMAAKQETGVSAIDELGALALVMLMRPDPVAAFFHGTEGCLGPEHDLDA